MTGALARMILVAGAEARSNFSAQFLKRLPLTEDHAEWRITLTLVETYIQEGNQAFISALPELAGHCLNSVNHLNVEIPTDKRTLIKIGQFAQKIHSNNAQLFAELKEKTPEKVWTKLQKANAK